MQDPNTAITSMYFPRGCSNQPDIRVQRSVVVNRDVCHTKFALEHSVPRSMMRLHHLRWFHRKEHHLNALKKPVTLDRRWTHREPNDQEIWSRPYEVHATLKHVQSSPRCTNRVKAEKGCWFHPRCPFVNYYGAVPCVIEGVVGLH